MVGLGPILTALGGTDGGAQAGSYDLLLSNGRVIYPESGLDGARNVGIRDGSIVVSSEEEIGRISSVSTIQTPALDSDIQEIATYGDLFVPPLGLSHVIVGGRIVVDQGVVVEGRYPGQRILGQGGTI